MSENMLEIRNLLIEAEIEDSWKPIVNGLSLKLQKGEIVGLIGESGAGKSTLGLAALGYTKPGCRIVSGSIRFDGPRRALSAFQKARFRVYKSRTSVTGMLLIWFTERERFSRI